MGTLGVEMKEVLPWLIRCWACVAGTRDFFSAFAAHVSPVNKFLYLTVHKLSRQPCWAACLSIICVSGNNIQYFKTESWNYSSTRDYNSVAIFPVSNMCWEAERIEYYIRCSSTFPRNLSEHMDRQARTGDTVLETTGRIQNTAVVAGRRRSKDDGK